MSTSPEPPPASSGSARERLLPWFRSPTGLLALVASAALAASVVVPSWRWIAIVAAGLLVAVLARVAIRSSIATERVSEVLTDSRASLTETRTSLAELRREHDRATADQAAAIRLLQERLDATQTAVEKDLTPRVADLTATATAAIARLDEGLKTERSDRSLVIAHQSDDARLPLRRVLLQMTVHRSGSTRFFDVMRTHPAVRVTPTMEVWERLGLTGRRYPVAFSDTSGSFMPVEVEFGEGATIPQVPVADLPAPPADQRWALEKAHPQFMDFDAPRLAEQITALSDDGVEVLIAYGIRRPLDAMWSMVDFKARQPSWYVSLGPADIPEWIRRSLESIDELERLCGGLVVDYADFFDGRSLRGLAQRLDPTWTREQAEEWMQFAGDQITPAKRTQKEGSGFMGTATPVRSAAGPDGAWAPLASVIEAADEIYDRLLARRSEA